MKVKIKLGIWMSCMINHQTCQKSFPLQKTTLPTSLTISWTNVKMANELETYGNYLIKCAGSKYQPRNTCEKYVSGTPAYDEYLWLLYAISKYMNHTYYLKMILESIQNSYNSSKELVGYHLQVFNFLLDYHTDSWTPIIPLIIKTWY